jgi:hypothetical protein
MRSVCTLSQRSLDSWQRAQVREFRALAERLADQQGETEGEAEGGSLESRLAEFIQETQQWCGEVLQQVQPKPRPAALPETPWSAPWTATDGVNRGRLQPLSGVVAESCGAEGADTSHEHV